MAALRRGVAHYQVGSENTTTADATAPPVSSAPAAPANPYFPAGMPASQAPSGFRQLLGGQFDAARVNPNSSPFTAALGTLGDYLSRSNRVDAVSKGPSMGDRLMNLFTGNQASTAAIAQHDQASTALKDPLVQQHLMNNPDEIALAEQNRLAYAAKTQTPEFRKVIEQAVAANTAAGANPKVTTDEHPKVVSTAVNNGVTADAAHASIAPHKYTRDEFIKATEGMTTNNFRLMFGQQLQHVATPQEKVATELFDRLHGAHADATAKVNSMIAEDAERVKQGKNPVHSQSWFGKSPLDIAKEQQKAAEKAILDAASSYAGISQKPFQVPPTQ